MKPAAGAAIVMAMGFLTTTAFGQMSRGDRYSGAAWATRSPVLGAARHGRDRAAARFADRHRHSEERRQRGRCRDCRQRGDRIDAAGAERHRRRSVSPSSGIRRPTRSTATTAPGVRRKGRDLAKLKAEIEAVYKKAGKPYAPHIPPVGSLPITVPGTVDAWFALHDRFGKLPMTEDLAPAISYATNGFPVTQLIASYWKGNMAAFEKNKAMIEELDNARAHLSDRRAHAGGRRDFQEPRSRAHAFADRRGRARCLLQGRDRAHDRRLFQAHRRRSALRGFRRASRRMGEPRIGELSRLRCLRIAAQRPGRGGAADAADPRRATI